MKTLNLVNPKGYGIMYKISSFPDGQQQLTLKVNTKVTPVTPLTSILETVKANDTVVIKSRLNNFKDLELICCAVASLKEFNIKNIELYVPYFLGSRSDRKFEEGSNNYLKTVICPIINSLGFTKVTVLDPHSDVLEACLNNFNKDSNIKLIVHSLGKIYKDLSLNQFILVSPDAGANKKIYKLAEEIGYKGEVITCSKSRDIDGKLTKTEVPITREHLNKDLIIIDDICDGGATFINIAKAIREKQNEYKMLGYEYNKIYLIVTHGIFSKGFEELNKYFDGIYCTNSYSDIPDYYDNGMQKFKTNVKQLNIF